MVGSAVRRQTTATLTKRKGADRWMRSRLFLLRGAPSITARRLRCAALEQGMYGWTVSKRLWIVKRTIPPSTTHVGMNWHRSRICRRRAWGMITLWAAFAMRKLA